MTETSKDCGFCNYNWIPRTPNPKACPRCKKRFDAPNGSGN